MKVIELKENHKSHVYVQILLNFPNTYIIVIDTCCLQK